YLPSDVVEELLKADQDEADIAIASDHALEEVIRQVRRQSYAFISGDVVPGLSAVSAPVFDAQGKLVAAITIMGRSGQYRKTEQNQFVLALCQAAKQVSRENGFSGSGRHPSYAEWLARVWRSEN